MEHPTIVIHMCKLRAVKHRIGTPTPAHVRLAMYEPCKEEPNDRVGALGLMNRRADFRWWLPAGKGLPEFFSQNFAFEPVPRTKTEFINETAFVKTDEENLQYAVKLSPVHCTPCIDTYNLGKYEVEGVVHNVVVFFTQDLNVCVTAPGLKDGCAYDLNTAMRYADEEFFDFLHLSLTDLGFTTLYVKPAAEKFAEIDPVKNPRIDRIAWFKCEHTGQQMRVDIDTPKNYRHPNYTILRATKPEHQFAMATSEELRMALQRSMDWDGQFSVHETFGWV